MIHHLPPLNALKAFEAAARHLSFVRAAGELCVTQGAVSRHILKLEEFLGVKLFIRRHRQVELTREGATYLWEIRSAFTPWARPPGSGSTAAVAPPEAEGSAPGASATATGSE